MCYPGCIPVSSGATPGHSMASPCPGAFTGPPGPSPRSDPPAPSPAIPGLTEHPRASPSPSNSGPLHVVCPKAPTWHSLSPCPLLPPPPPRHARGAAEGVAGETRMCPGNTRRAGRDRNCPGMPGRSKRGNDGHEETRVRRGSLRRACGRMDQGGSRGGVDGAAVVVHHGGIQISL